MMGEKVFFSLLCPRVFYQDYKAMIQQEKRNKEKFQIPKDSKREMIRWHLSQSLGYYSLLL